MLALPGRGQAVDVQEAEVKQGMDQRYTIRGLVPDGGTHRNEAASSSVYHPAHDLPDLAREVNGLCASGRTDQPTFSNSTRYACLETPNVGRCCEEAESSN